LCPQDAPSWPAQPWRLPRRGSWALFSLRSYADRCVRDKVVSRGTDNIRGAMSWQTGHAAGIDASLIFANPENTPQSAHWYS
jgi:hypothetical protein